MTREEVLKKLEEIFQGVFDSDSISINELTVDSDVEGADSLTHLTLFGTIEDEFKIKFPMKDIVGIKNVGQLVDKILELSGK